MCTVTWLLEPDGYQLFFNRDEKKTRRPAQPPARHDADGVRMIFPRDGDAGGSWIGVNEFGLSIGLLNHHPAPPPPRCEIRTSRGHLLLGLLSSRSLDEVRRRAGEEDPGQYRPFILAAFAPGAPMLELVSDGQALREESPGDLPIISTSSYLSGEVVRSRRDHFSRLHSKQETRNSKQLIAFHGRHIPDRGAFSVCMHRDDAETLSFSHLQVGPGTVRFTYSGTSPCRMKLMDPLEMPRRRK